MLKLLSSENQVLQVDDFYILEKSSGLDELVFNISIYDENYPYILEEAVIEYEQPYLVKAIDAGSDTAKVKCQLDLDELKADMKVGYSNNSNTLFLTVNPILPDGWVFIDESGSTISRTIEGDFTPYDIITECASTYDVVFRFKPKERQIYAYSLASFQPLGTFASRELNLKEINYKGKSTDFFTRLYAYGKDGLSFADINDGNEYVENFEYTDKVISTVMRDERYTTMEGLLEAAKKAVKTGGIPTCSYECTVYDLAATNPEMYKFQDFSLFSVVKLIDDIKKISVNHQVVEYKRYPKYPEKNVVTLSTTTTKLQNTVKNLKNEIENPQSAFRVLMQNTINNLAASIAGYNGGNMVITENDNGKPNGIMIMDTDSQDTAKNILWFNLNGMTYSSNGVNGPYDTVWSFEEGGFIADWIVAGNLIADIMKTGKLSDAKGRNYWNLDTGEFLLSAYATTEETDEKFRRTLKEILVEYAVTDSPETPPNSSTRNKLGAPKIYLDATAEKLDAPVIRLESSDTSTTAVLGKAVLGSMVLGTGATSEAVMLLATEQLDTPEIYLEEVNAKLATPRIYLTDNGTDSIWSTEQPTWVDGQYVWQRLTYIYMDGATVVGEPVCITGNTGRPGEDGKDGRVTYLHIKYSAVENPTTADEMSETPDAYMGTYTDFLEEDSDNPADYTWYKIKGDDGAPGETVNGKTSYFHVKYSNDGGATFTDGNGEVAGEYMGTYTDFTEADSTDPADYNWYKTKGEDGAAGRDAITFRIESSLGTTFLSGTDSKTVLTARIYKGTVELDSAGAYGYTWYLVETDNTERVLGTGKTLSVSASTIAGKGVYFIADDGGIEEEMVQLDTPVIELVEILEKLDTPVIYLESPPKLETPIIWIEEVA